MAWFNFPITQPFGLPYEPSLGGHSGVDLGVPNNTPLYLPYDGKVIEADYKSEGGRIAVLTPQGMMVFLHANQIDVIPGEAYHAGQILGTSGGGVGDKLLNPATGQVYTATSQADFAGQSTAPHVHFSVFNVTDIAGIDAALDGNVNRINPMPFIASFIASKPILTTASGSTNAPTSDTTQPTIASLFDFSSWGQKIGVFLIALIVIGGGFYLLFSDQINAGVKAGAGKVKEAGELALV